MRRRATDTCADGLGWLIGAETGGRVTHYQDIYHTLTTEAVGIKNDAVRQLTVVVLPLLEASGLGASSFDAIRTSLSEGTVAGAIVSGKVVAAASTGAVTAKYADIAVRTAEPWRGRGFATAAASIVVKRVQEKGRIPVWSCGEDNWASLRVAEKLGFEEVSRLTYVIRVG